MRRESAAEHVVTGVPVVRRDVPVSRVLGGLAGRELDAVDTVYVIDDAERVVGTVPTTALLGAAGDTAIGQLADPDFAHVGLDHDQEHVAGIARARGATSVAVLDDDDRLMGVVPAKSLLAILHQEHVEDLHRLAGIQREVAHDHEALEEPPVRSARHRIPWLLVGLAGSMVAAAVMSAFERVLHERVAIAFFVPTIVYLADAIGTQTEAIAVRGLSVSRQPLRRLLGGELRTGLLIGVVLAVLAFPIVALGFGDPRLAFAVAVAIAGAGAVAATIGLLFPWLLQHLGTDPAFGSGPVATIIQDVLSILIYFAIVLLLL